MEDTLNIVVFGQPGVGKSSLVNQLAGTSVAETSDSGQDQEEPFSSTPFVLDVAFRQPSRKTVIWDTQGLNDDESKGEISREALDRLKKLASTLNEHGGLGLLIFVVRAARLTGRTVRANYDMFVNRIGRSKVPLILVITGLEEEEVMDQWWGYNKISLEHLGLPVDRLETRHVCITAIKGRTWKGSNGFVYETEYQASRSAVMRLIDEYHLESGLVLELDSLEAGIPKNFPTSKLRSRGGRPGVLCGTNCTIQ